MKVIGFCGAAGAGKSTAADRLVHCHGFRRVRFAGPLKRMMWALGLDERHTDGALKELPCGLLGGRTPRFAMQTLGTEWGRDIIAQDLWLRAWRAEVTAACKLVVVDDVRFANEAEAVRQAGGTLIRITGRGGISGGHVSELQDFAVHHTIDNAGCFDDFLAAVDGVAKTDP